MMTNEQKQILLSRLTMYIDGISSSQPNLSSRILQEQMSKEIVSIVEQVLLSTKFNNEPGLTE